MLSPRKPTPSVIEQFLKEQGGLPFSYDAVGATATQAPAGYVVDRTRVKLGEGARVYQSAVVALRRWKQFDLGWVEVWPTEPPIQTGECVAILGCTGGCWALNACRIAYVVDEQGPWTRFGFAYGTLPAHIQTGEERFQVEWSHEDDSVWYEILAFSRPTRLLARIGYPVVRRAQKRFGRDSAAAMQRAVRASLGPGPERSEATAPTPTP